MIENNSEKVSSKMKIGILQCGRVPDVMLDKYGDYDKIFADFLGREHFAYENWPVLDDVLPESIDDADGWLITGSKYGVYEEHSWIPSLENFIQSVYAGGTPIIGVCFGHQILAQALGGKVEKFDGGWSVGHVFYNIEDEETPSGVHAFHQDQIIELPDEAVSYGSTDFCQHAFVKYAGKALSLQPHPEFTDEFLSDLLACRGDTLPNAVQSNGANSIGQPLNSPNIGIQMTNFFLNNRKTLEHKSNNSAS